MQKKEATGYIRERYNKLGERTYFQVVINTGTIEVNGKKKKQEQFFKAYSREEAEELLAIKKAQYVLHRKQFANPALMTLKFFIEEEYMPNFVIGVLKESSARSYRQNCKYILACLGEIKLRDITTNRLQQMYNQLLKKSPFSGKPLSYRTVTDIKRQITCILNTCIACNYMYENPNMGVKLRKPPRLEEEKKEIYTMEEMAILLNGAKGTDMEAPLLVVFDGGLRRGEVCALEFSDFDFENKTVTISKNLTQGLESEAVLTTVKSASSKRIVHLTDVTMEAVKRAHVQYKKLQLSKGTNFVPSNRLVYNPKNGAGINPHSFYTKFKRLCKELGLPPIRLHGLRSTSITLAIENGAPIKAVSAKVGHKDVKITENIYLKNTEKMTAQTTEVMSKIMEEVVNK